MHMRRYLCVASLVLIAACVGCSYGETSHEAYEYAKALYSISNRRDAKRLDQVSEMVGSSRTVGDITRQEAEWLNDIIQLARNDNWEQAMRRARALMEDQVE